MTRTSARHRRPSWVRTMAFRGATVGVAAGAAALGLASPALAAPASTWDSVAQCESSGNWSIDTGNGYYGGLQFSDSTWDAYGGERYASTANRATKAQQITVAQKVLAAQGPGAWPTCGARAGLTRANGGAVNAGSTATTVSRSAVRRAPVRSVSAGKLVVDGVRGPKTNAAIERWVGGSVNGNLSRTDVKALQRKVGSAPDGVIGPRTVRALQTKIGAKRNGSHSLDRATVRSLQSYLNQH